MRELNIQALPRVLGRYSDNEVVALLAIDPTNPASQLRDAAILFARRGSPEVTASIISLYLATQDNSPEVLASTTRVMHGALKNAERRARSDADRFGSHPIQYSFEPQVFAWASRSHHDYADRARRSAEELIR